MDDAVKNPSGDWLLKLYWASDEGVAVFEQSVIVELQDSKGLALGTLLVPSDQLLQAAA